MEAAASLARERFTISLNSPPNRTRHIPRHLASGSSVAMTRPSFEPTLSWRPSQTSSFLPKQCRPVFEGRRKGCRGLAGARIRTPCWSTAACTYRSQSCRTAFASRWCAARASHGRKQWRRVRVGGKAARGHHRPLSDANRKVVHRRHPCVGNPPAAFVLWRDSRKPAYQHRIHA